MQKPHAFNKAYVHMKTHVFKQQLDDFKVAPEAQMQLEIFLEQW